MLIGIVRTSTTDQEASFEAQHEQLSKAGCEKVFAERVSAVGPRPQLEAAMDFAREGDTIVCTSLCRLARSVAHLMAILERLEKKGVGLRILNLGMDTSTPTGRLMVNVLGSVNQFEREILLERQRIGIAKARAEKRYKGRSPTARSKAGRVQEMARTGMTKAAIAQELGISMRSVFRVLAGGG